MENNLIYGVGLNDSKESVSLYKEGRETWRSPYYQKWKDMLKRCYSNNYHSKNSYANCVVCEEWLTFSNFKSWMETQDWEGKQLDKDLLGDGKLYSPETCVFLNSKLNSFIRTNKLSKIILIGVEKRLNGNYRVAFKNPLVTNGQVFRGTFKTELEAHLFWKAKKHEYACMLADMQEDERLAKALRERYAPDKDWTIR